MNVIDIIVLVILLYALWKGWSSGVLVQLSGVLGIILGAWIAFRFSVVFCEWFGVDIKYKWLVFIATIIVVFIVVAILCRLLTKALDYGGMSVPVKLLGAVASVCKLIIILALVLRTFDNIDSKMEFTDGVYIRESKSYKPLNEVASWLFPYISLVWNDIDKDGEISRQIEEQIESEVERQVERQVEKQIEEKLEHLQNNNDESDE